MPAIRQFLDLSTAHLDEASKRWLTNAAWDASAFHGCYGWFAATYPDTDNPGHSEVTTGSGDLQAPAALATIFEYACTLGCDYVLFDDDAEIDPALATFEDGE
jgi:hypothetical protein